MYRCRVKDQKDIQENLKRVEGERAQQLADDMFPAEDKVRAITEKMTEIGEKLRLTLVEMRGLVTEFGWEDYTAGADAANEGTRKLNEMIIQNTKSAEKMFETNKFTEGIITGIADVWSSSFSTMRRSQQSFSEWFKGTWLDMADYAIDQTQKMMMNYLLLGSVSGKSGGTSFFGTSSGGYGGLIGGILGAVKLQEGGQFWVDRPTPLLVGEGGKREFISVTPESKMNRRPEGGDTTIINSYMYIEATDVDSFERKYGGSVTKIVHRNKKSGGMRG